MDLGSAFIHERQENTRKIRTKKEGVPSGNPLEKGIIIIPCMPRIQTSLVEVRCILVWELGQTCEAARNGTRNVLEIILECILEKILGVTQSKKKRPQISSDSMLK